MVLKFWYVAEILELRALAFATNSRYFQTTHFHYGVTRQTCGHVLAQLFPKKGFNWYYHQGMIKEKEIPTKEMIEPGSCLRKKWKMYAQSEGILPENSLQWFTSFFFAFSYSSCIISKMLIHFDIGSRCFTVPFHPFLHSRWIANSWVKGHRG